MRILICSNAYPPHFVGGAELMAHEQARALLRLGHEVRVFAGELNSPRARYSRADDLYEDVRVHRIATAPEDYSPEYLNFLHPRVDAHFDDILKDFTPDIVHFHNLIGLSVKLPILAKQARARTICTLHDFWGFCLLNTAVRSDGGPCDDPSQCGSCVSRVHDGRRLHVPLRFRKDFLRLALDHVDRFIAPSRFVAQRYVWAGMPADRLTVIQNGIDVDRFHRKLESRSSSGIQIAYVGYFGAHKGVATLLDAFALLPQRGPPATLQLAGEGPEYDAYLARIDALGLRDRVNFLGKIQPADMPEVYMGSDILVLPSVWDENQPVCLMEAMASGLPVVASRKGGIPELIDHGANGLMFEAGDASDLAVQLGSLAEDADLRQALGQEGRLRVEQFSHARQARRQVELYVEAARLAPTFPRSRILFAATGRLRSKMTDERERLADRRYRSRYLVPLGWIEDCLSGAGGFKLGGVVLTGRLWSALRLLKMDAVIPLPRAIGDFWAVILDAVKRRSRRLPP